MALQLSNSINRTRKAASVALDRATKLTGGEGDEDLRVYSNLPVEAFDRLVEKYGAEDVIHYIKAMEAKKMKRGDNG